MKDELKQGEFPYEPHGVYDPVDGVWIGDEGGPYSYNNPVMGRLAAEVLDVVLGYERGRLKPLPYPHDKLRLKDEAPVVVDSLTAIRKLEDGSEL